MPDEAVSPDEVVRYEVRDRVAHVTISNGKANALSPAVVAGLDAALTRAEDAGEEQVGALLIAGAPGMLSGGFDLAVMKSGAGAAGRLVTDGGALITRLFGSEIPVVIACSGHAVAAGALLLLGADARIGARGAFACLPANSSSRPSAPRCTTPTARCRWDSSMAWSSPTRSTRARPRKPVGGRRCPAPRTAGRCG